MAYQNNTAAEASANPSSLPSEIITYFNHQLTKSRLRILEALAEKDGLQQKDLSEVLNISKNNLSNMLSKLDQIHPKLLNVTISGRSRIYTLTNEARAYLDHLNSNTTVNIRNFTDVNSSDYLCGQAIECLEQIKKISATDWDSAFDSWLSMKDKPSEPATPLEKLYVEFMELIISLTLDGQSTTLVRVYSYIGNNILEKNINEMVKKMLGSHHYLLLPLYQLEKQNTKLAQEILNSIIHDLYPTIMPNASQPKKGITDAQYYSFFFAVTQMWNEFLKHGTKEEALESWGNKYVCKSCIPEYLANTFCLIYRILKQSSI